MVQRHPGRPRSTSPGLKVADAICFDVAYDDGLYAQLSHGGQLVVVQTSNAMFIHTAQIDQQFAISRLRAIETAPLRRGGGDQRHHRRDRPRRVRGRVDAPAPGRTSTRRSGCSTR